MKDDHPTLCPSRGVIRHRCTLSWVRRRGHLLIVALAVLLPASYGCSENHEGSRSTKRMAVSTGKFHQGYKDGRRDAKNAWADANGAWMWQWMMEKEYNQGYEQGWSDGRSAQRLKKKQEQLQTDP